MNELEHAVRVLLAQTPPAPQLEGLERRARHRRLRDMSAIVVVAVVIAAATVGVAGALGHRASSPQIAVSPTTSTTVNVNTSACALGFLEQQKAQLEQLEKQLNDKLTGELAAHSLNAGATDAAHQAVLRELSDIDHRILTEEDAAGDRPDLGSPAHTLHPDDPRCTAIATTTTTTTVSAAAVAAWSSQFHFLDAQRVQLQTLEQQLSQRLTAELAAHSPNAGATDAAHQAVLRAQSDVQQRILRLEESRPNGGLTLPSAGEPRASTTVSTP
jgi:hypothetical protein